VTQGGMDNPAKQGVQGHHPYVFGNTPEIATEELTRLALQDRVFTRAYGIFPRDLALPTPVSRILDLACGTGGWLLEAASHLQGQGLQLAEGIDKDPAMVAFARAQARVRHVEHLISFEEGDILKDLEKVRERGFYDLIHCRFISAFLPASYWPTLASTCKALLKKGGILLLCENEIAVTNSPGYNRLSQIFLRALHQSGMNFGGEVCWGVTALFRKFLRDAGFAPIQVQSHALEFSTGTAHHEMLLKDFQLGVHTAKPFLLKYGRISKEEYEAVLQQLWHDFQSEDFYAVVYGLSAWGRA
jgi:SAM-dependent methyltransferase